MAHVPKYMNIVDWTVEQITIGVYNPKDRFLSESELCDRFRCSRQTVRRALDILEQRGLITRVQGSGTYISSANSLNELSNSDNKRSDITVGLISTFMDNYVFPSIIRGIERVFTEEGINIQLASTNNLVSGEKKALLMMMDRKLDGLIVEPTRSALPCVNIDLYQKITEMGIPFIFIDSFYPELSIPYVALDDVKAGYMATEYLIKNGHRNISGVFPHSNRQAHLRYLGYVKALTDYGIQMYDDRVCWYSRDDMKQVLYGKPLLERLAASTAVLSYNDVTAMMIIDSVQRNGRKVPDDLSVVGIDNSELAEFSKLTSVVHPGEQLGESAAKLLLSIINGSEGKTILFPPRLIERNSVRKIGDS